jgi:arylsulfatase A-like enzyme
MSAMKKMTKIFLFAAVVVPVGIFISCQERGCDHFYRVRIEGFLPGTEHFKIDEQMGKIYFQKGKDRFQLNEIPTPDGYYFYLNGKKQIKLMPRFSGDIGFYTYIYFKSRSKSSPIDFSFEIYSQGANQKISQIAAANVSRPFFKDLKIAGSDQLLLKFKGRGVVYLGRPIIYKKRSSAQRKNIIFIALDTLRGDQIGAHPGNRQSTLTPNIDRFIKDAVYFKNAYAQTSWTLPSFMSLFTGMYEYNHEVGIKNPLSLDKPFLIEELSREFITFGYHGGKVMKSRWGYWRGFDYYKKYRFASALFSRGGQALFQKAIQLLKTSNFPNLFLFLHTYQVHAPYTPPEEFLYKLNKKPKFKKLEAINDNNPAKTYWPVETDVKKSLKELYQAEILAFDAYFGEFVKRLKAMNLYDNAMIIFMSDHGEEFFEHNGWTHSHSLYNEQIRVPVIIKFPGNRFKNRRIPDVVGVIDLLPTILSYYNIDYEAAKLDGTTLMPLIKNSQARRPGYVVSTISTGRYFEAIPPKIAVLFDHYKLIYNHPFSPEDLAFFKDYTRPPETPKFELYDLENDPYEMNNIAYPPINDPQAVPLHRKKMMSVIAAIEKKIKQKMSEIAKKKKSLDKEVEEQLKSLGYL